MDMYVIEMCVTRKKPIDRLYIFDDGSAVKISNNGVFTFLTATLTDDEAISFLLAEFDKLKIECPTERKSVGNYAYYIIRKDILDVQYRISKQEFGKSVYDSGYAEV